MSRPALRIGLAGLGTVGTGVVRILQQHGDTLARRCGRALELTAVAAANPGRKRDVDLGSVQIGADPLALARDPRIDVVVEAIGGSDGPAKQLVQAAIEAGKSVVTANKALLAHHGTALALLAERHGVQLNFEAAVAGGIPIVKVLREGLAGNDIIRVYGILNGTCNYILTNMEKTGADFAACLKEAQAQGFAEADPSFDIGGVDAAHKLSILAALAFGTKIDFAGVHVEGIGTIEANDIAFAHELGYRIKLLGIARRVRTRVQQRVHPCLVPLGTPIADVSGVFNAVVVEGDFVGRVFMEGRGAGGGPTASAIVADLSDLARGLKLPAFAVPAEQLEDNVRVPMADHAGPCYVRLTVLDRPGVMAAVTAALARFEVSIETMIQRGRAPGEQVALVMVLHDARESDVQKALLEIAKLPSVVGPPRMIRIEAF